MNKVSFPIPASMFQVATSAADEGDTVRYQLHHLKVEVAKDDDGNGILRTVATDAIQLVYATWKAPAGVLPDETFSFFVSAKECSSISKLALTKVHFFQGTNIGSPFVICEVELDETNIPKTVSFTGKAGHHIVVQQDDSIRFPKWKDVVPSFKPHERLEFDVKPHSLFKLAKSLSSMAGKNGRLKFYVPHSDDPPLLFEYTNEHDSLDITTGGCIAVNADNNETKKRKQLDPYSLIFEFLKNHNLLKIAIDMLTNSQVAYLKHLAGSNQSDNQDTKQNASPADDPPADNPADNPPADSPANSLDEMDEELTIDGKPLTPELLLEILTEAGILTN